MKLIEENGTVSEDVPDDAAVLIVHADRTIRVVTPRYREGRIPFHVRLVRGLASFLVHETNVLAVMRHAPTERNPKHRHH